MPGIFCHSGQVLLVAFFAVAKFTRRPLALPGVFPVQQLLPIFADTQRAPCTIFAGVVGKCCGDFVTCFLAEGNGNTVERGAQGLRNAAHGADRLVAALHVTETSSELVVDVVVGVVRGQALLVVAETEASAQPRGGVVLCSSAGVVGAAVVEAADNRSDSADTQGNGAEGACNGAQPAHGGTSADHAGTSTQRRSKAIGKQAGCPVACADAECA